MGRLLSCGLRSILLWAGCQSNDQADQHLNCNFLNRARAGDPARTGSHAGGLIGRPAGPGSAGDPGSAWQRPVGFIDGRVEWH
jgi:hypothetical protein